MGTSGSAIFEDDLAADIRDQFVELLHLGRSPESATEALAHDWSDSLADEDDGPVFWLALAATQWKCGCLQGQVRDQALLVIENGSSLARWHGPAAKRRKAVLEKLRETLQLPQPPFKRPRRKAAKPLAFKQCASPDGTASVRATEYAPQYGSKPCWAQISVESIAEGTLGGAGLGVVQCRFEEVEFEWLGPDSVRVLLPEEAVPPIREVPVRHFKRIISVEYASL